MEAATPPIPSKDAEADHLGENVSPQHPTNTGHFCPSKFFLHILPFYHFIYCLLHYFYWLATLHNNFCYIPSVYVTAVFLSYFSYYYVSYLGE
jgi:uncharacterized membrane protein